MLQLGHPKAKLAAVVEAAVAPQRRHIDWKVGLQLPIVVLVVVAEQAAEDKPHTEPVGQRKRKGSGPGRRTLYRNMNAVKVDN